MREIKFRAWFPKSKNMEFLEKMWLCGEYTSLCFSPLDAGIMGFKDHDANYDYFNYKEELGYVLMQYTGLKDKNGKEIYEGDILTISDNSISVVKWEQTPTDADPGNFVSVKSGWRFGRAGEYCKEWQVIGNIYENLELLTNHQ